MPYLDTLRWVFIAVVLGGIAATIYVRLDNWKRAAMIGGLGITLWPIVTGSPKLHRITIWR